MTIRDSVRRNAGSAGIAALLLIYFGFLAGLIEPTGTSLFDLGNRLFLYTLRIGGVAMAVITAWSMLGQPVALLVDAIVSILIGVVFVLSGAAMLLDQGGTQAFLNILFGVLFASAGVRNGREWAGFAGQRIAHGGHELDAPPDSDPRSHLAEVRPVSSSLVGQLPERAARTESTEEYACPTGSSEIADKGNGPTLRKRATPSEREESTRIAPEPIQPTPRVESPESAQAPTPDEASVVEAGARREDMKPSAPSGDGPDPSNQALPPPEPPGGFLASFADEDSPGRI